MLFRRLIENESYQRNITCEKFTVIIICKLLNVIGILFIQITNHYIDIPIGNTFSVTYPFFVMLNSTILSRTFEGV